MEPIFGAGTAFGPPPSARLQGRETYVAHASTTPTRDCGATEIRGHEVQPEGRLEARRQLLDERCPKAGPAFHDPGSELGPVKKGIGQRAPRSDRRIDADEALRGGILRVRSGDRKSESFPPARRPHHGRLDRRAGPNGETDPFGRAWPAQKGTAWHL